MSSSVSGELKNISTQTLILSVIIATTLISIFVIIFEKLRKKYKYVYDNLSAKYVTILICYSFPSITSAPNSLFGLMKALLSKQIPRNEIERHGMSAYTILVFIKTCLFTTAFASVIGFILIFINYFAVAKDNSAVDYSNDSLLEGVEVLSIEHIPNGSKVLWLHYISVWLISVFVIYLIGKYYKEVLLFYFFNIFSMYILRECIVTLILYQIEQ